MTHRQALFALADCGLLEGLGVNKVVQFVIEGTAPRPLPPPLVSPMNPNPMNPPVPPGYSSSPGSGCGRSTRAVLSEPALEYRALACDAPIG